MGGVVVSRVSHGVSLCTTRGTDRQAGRAAATPVWARCRLLVDSCTSTPSPSRYPGWTRLTQPSGSPTLTSIRTCSSSLPHPHPLPYFPVSVSYSQSLYRIKIRLSHWFHLLAIKLISTPLKYPILFLPPPPPPLCSGTIPSFLPVGLGFRFRFFIHQVLQGKCLESGKHTNISKQQHWHTSTSNPFALTKQHPNAHTHTCTSAHARTHTHTHTHTHTCYKYE